MKNELKLGVEATYADGSKERGEAPILPTEQERAEQRVSETLITVGDRKDIDELRKSDPEKAADLEEYYKGVTDQARDFLISNRGSYDAIGLADVLGLMGNRMESVKTAESIGPSSGDPKLDASEQLEVQRVKQMYKEICSKLFPEAVIDKNGEGIDAYLKQVVAILDRRGSIGEGTAELIKNIDVKAYTPSELILNLQERALDLSKLMGGLTNVEQDDVFRGYGVEKPVDVLAMGKALFLLDQMTDLLKVKEYGRSDVTVQEAQAIHGVQKKIGDHFSEGGSGVERRQPSAFQTEAEKDLGFLENHIPDSYNLVPDFNKMDDETAKKFSVEAKALWHAYNKERRGSDASARSSVTRMYRVKVAELIKRYR